MAFATMLRVLATAWDDFGCGINLDMVSLSPQSSSLKVVISSFRVQDMKL